MMIFSTKYIFLSIIIIVTFGCPENSEEQNKRRKESVFSSRLKAPPKKLGIKKLPPRKTRRYKVVEEKTKEERCLALYKILKEKNANFRKILERGSKKDEQEEQKNEKNGIKNAVKELKLEDQASFLKRCLTFEDKEIECLYPASSDVMLDCAEWGYSKKDEKIRRNRKRKY